MSSLINKKNWMYWLLLGCICILLFLFFKSKMKTKRIEKELKTISSFNPISNQQNLQS